MPVIREVPFDDSQSSVEPNELQPQEKLLREFAKHMLQSRLFIGTYHEKRYVDSLKAYRNVIVIDSEEIDLIRDLDVVKKRVCGYYGHSHWIGITDPAMVGAPAHHCLWVELPDEVFGCYWYKISKVKFRPSETLIRLKVIRPVCTAAKDVATTLKSPHVGNSSSDDSQRNANDLGDSNKDDSLTPAQRSLNGSLVAIKTVVINSMSSFFREILTIRNIKETVKFISVLIVAIFTGLVQFLQYLGDFTIRFMGEISVFIKATTPIIIACINLIGKIVGGFYLMIISLWKDRKGPPPIYRSPYGNQINFRHGDGFDTYKTVYFRRPLPLLPANRNRGGVTITPLD